RRRIHPRPPLRDHGRALARVRRRRPRGRRAACPRRVRHGVDQGVSRPAGCGGCSPGMTAVDEPIAEQTPARVKLRFAPEGGEVRVPAGTTVFDGASWNGIAIDSTCGGHGTCKKGRVKITPGNVPLGPPPGPAPTPDELRPG